MKKLLEIAFILVLTSIVISCEDEEDKVIPPSSNSPKISLSTTDTSWFLKTQPDSIVVTITKGVAPFFISERFQFAALAQIRGKDLIIYPNQDENTGIYGKDSIKIEDNEGNSVDFKVEVENLTLTYLHLNSVSVTLIGDTNLTITNPRAFQARWLRFEGRSSIVIQDSSFNFLNLQFPLLNNPGMNQFTDRNGISFDLLRQPNNQVLRLRMKDPSQPINVIKLNENEVEMEVKADLIDIDGFYTNDFDFEAKFSASR